jgi:hypothetical protein
MDLTKPLILMFSFSDVHNITRLLGCILCDHVLGKHDSPSTPKFLTNSSLMGEHLCCILWSFRQATIFLSKKKITTSFFGNKASSSCFSNVISILYKVQSYSSLRVRHSWNLGSRATHLGVTNIIYTLPMVALKQGW